MKQNALKQGLNVFNLLFVATFIVLALYSAIGQQIFPFLGQYRPQLETYLSSQLNGDVSIRRLVGDMDVLTPSVRIEGVQLFTDDDPDHAKVSIAAIDAVLDSSRSLLNLTPVFKSVRLSGLYVRVDGDKEESQKPIDEDDVVLVKRMLDALLLQQHVELNNVTVENVRGRETKILHLDHLVMTGDGFNRLITGNMSYGGDNKIKAGIRLYSQGSPFDLDRFYARGALDLPDVDVDYWVNEWFDMSLFKEFSASAQLRFEFQDGLLNYSKLSLASPTVYISDGRKIDSVNAQLWSKQKAVDEWVFWLGDSVFSLKESSWRFGDIGLSIAKNTMGNRWQTHIKKMDLEYLQTFLATVNAVPAKLEPLLTNLQATGTIENMNVIVQQAGDDQSVTVVGEIKQLNTLASEGIPGVENVDVVVAANERSGRVQFTGQQTAIEFEGIYDAPLVFEQAQGQVDWFVQGQDIRLIGDGLNLKLNTIDAVRGGFNVWLYGDEKLEDKLALNLSIDNGQVAAHSALVPSILSANLRQWLDSALVDGAIDTGHLYLYSGLNADSQNQLELYLGVKNATLKYQEQWPVVKELSGQLFIHNDQVLVNVDTAQTLGGRANQGQIIFDGVEDNQLWVQTRVEGDMSEGLAYFQQTPLQSVVNSVMDPWQSQGQHATDLKLRIPLSGDEAGILADVSTRINNGALNISDVGLEFKQVKGAIDYKNSQGITSSGLSATLWQQPLQAKIASQVHTQGFSTDISFNGPVEIQSLKDWIKLDLLKPISGKTSLNGHFKISGENNGFTGLELSSNLSGIKLALPEPFMKATSEEQAFKLRLALDDGQKLFISYADQMSLAMHLKNAEVKSGQVYLGATEAYIPSTPGLVIQGHVAQVDVQPWLDVWQKLDLKRNSSNDTSPSLIRQINVSTDQLTYQDRVFEQVKADIQVQQNAWNIQLDAPIAKGLIVLAENQPLGLDLDYIHWPALLEPIEKESEGVEEDLFAALTPDMFPDVNLKVGEIFFGPRNYGRWHAKMRSKDGVLSITDIDGTIKKLDVKGSVTWEKQQDPSQLPLQETRINLKLASNDVGGVQKAWQTKPVLEAKDTKANLDLNWQASPSAIDAHLLNGSATISLKDGRFLDAGETGALSAFGILNFAAIGRRLRLDFSDVYQSGLHFDSVSGKMAIKDGVMTIVDTLDIKGPSAKFAASGSVNLNNKMLNQELSVTFPITSTLPFVAILAGFAPPVAASLFVGEQLVGDQIEKYTSATYSLTGPWDEPKLQLMKRFDNEIEGKQDKGFWYRMKDFFGLGDD